MRAAPGPQLSSGRLRVDAARAIAKLREYQLVDRTAWVLEAIRAAVASGATKIDLRGDANDVWLSWEGPTWPAEDLPRLFDELVSPEPTGGDEHERQHLRLLAAAVNSALGMNPAYVDVYANGSDGALRARYTPDVLDEAASPEDSPLRKVAATPADIPAEVASGTGMLVHVRRRVAIGMLTYLFWEREPPELATARAACRDIAVPLTVGGVTCHRDQVGHDLVRVPLGDDLDGFIAIVDPAAPRPAHIEATLEVAERGVVLAVYPLAMGPLGGPAAPDFELRGPVPLRVFLDAKRMPTNASRSQVRREVHPISTAQTRAATLAAKLVADLAADAMKPDANERTRATALAFIAAAIAGSGWTSLSSTHRLGPLAKVPLLRDATGAARSIDHAWDGLVYTGRKPLDPELAAWVSGMLWIRRGDPAAKLVAGVGIDKRDTNAKIAQAKKSRAAHRKFFGHAPRAPKIAPLPATPRLSAPLGTPVPGSCVPDSRFAGFDGEVAVSLDRIGGELTLMFKNRPIEHVDDFAWPIGFVATVDTERLTPDQEYAKVERDEYYHRVVLAVKCALVRAAEVIALELDGATTLPPGYVGGPHATYDVEARMVRAGLGLAKEDSLKLQSPLATAKAWRTLDGRWIDFLELATADVIGFSTAAQFEPPRDRLMLPGGKQLVGKLLPNVLMIDYDRAGEPTERAQRPALLAAKLASKHKFALEISGPRPGGTLDDDVCGAIAPTGAASSIRLHHAGRELDARPYTPTVLFGAVVAVDSDALVPDGDWRTAVDPASAARRPYADWEQQFLTAAARTLVGDRPLELHGPPVTGLDNELARSFLLAVVRPEHALDVAIALKLRTAKIIHVLGEPDLISIDELVRRFPTSIPYVDKLAAPVHGYAPMVADITTAIGIGKLAGVPVTDGSPALELRRRTVLRARRVEAHRAKAASPLAYPHGGEHVPLDVSATHVKVTGLVGVHTGRLEVEVRVEDRPFQVLTHTGELPLFAIVDLDSSFTDATFEGLADLASSHIIDAVRRTAGPLLMAIAKARPEALAELGAARTLLAAYVARMRAVMPAEVRVALNSAAAFTTLQGTRISLVSASHPRNAVRTARWQGEWIGCADGESPSPLDEGVLRAPELNSELHEILRSLFHGSIVDVSDEVAKLQSQRRMARGLIPAPALPHIPTELKRSLAQLGPIGKRLGHGEVGLVSGTVSYLFVHAHGEPRARFTLDVQPAIHLAIEDPDLAANEPPVAAGLRYLDPLGVLVEKTERSPDAPSSLSQQAQDLATRLVREVVGPSSDNALPPTIARSVRRALLARRLDQLVRSPVFELADQSWVPLEAVIDQIAKYGKAWAVLQPTTQQPLDDDRLVFLLSPDELGVASGNYAFVDASNELRLDDTARRNRAKPKATSLELGARDYILAQTELDGDGVTSMRGTVAALMPHAADERGLRTHKEMLPFEVLQDPCRWPTIAIVDDARLEPDRTWQRPKNPHPVWSELVARVSAASERGLAQLVQRPSGAFAHTYIGSAMVLGRLGGARLQVRGAVSLVGAPRPPQPAIEVFDAFGRHEYVPQRPLGMVGRLYVYAPDGWQRSTTLDEMLGHLYATLVKQLVGRRGPGAELAAAHIANALLLGHVIPSDVPGVTFDCFKPKPIGPNELALLRGGKDPYRVLAIAGLDSEPDDTGVVEDGSEVSRVVITHLGPRARRGPAERRAVLPDPKPASTPVPTADVWPPVVPVTATASAGNPASTIGFGQPQISIEPPKPKPKPAPKPPEPDHPIKILIDAVYRRLVDLGIPTFGVRIVDVASPIVRYDEARRLLRFAGRDARLHAVANAMHANSPWAQLAVDAVIAHASTVLDEACTEVTDDTQRHVLKMLLVGS